MLSGPCGWNEVPESATRNVRRTKPVLPDGPEPLDVERPAYYAHGIEPIDYMRSRFTPEEFRGYLLGSAVERLARLNARSASAEVSSMDIREAAHFLDLLLDFLKSQ